MAREPDSDDEPYELDEDGLIRSVVGPWVRDKHLRLTRYVDISRGVRANFIGEGKAGATYIDPFAGPGRARIRDTSEVVDGSPVAAWHMSAGGNVPFSDIYVADSRQDLLRACEIRLTNHRAPVKAEVGEASLTIDRIIQQLNPYALHFAFLDPFNLRALSFEIIRKLASLRRMDILLHISAHDLQRNLRTYLAQEESPLDSFAPGWRVMVDPRRSDEHVRAKILEHWRNLVRAEGMDTTESLELIVGPSNQRLYWLAFAARHERALEFWDKIRDVDKQGRLL